MVVKQVGLIMYPSRFDDLFCRGSSSWCRTVIFPLCGLVPLQLAPGVNAGQGLGIEIIATLQLVLCVLATTDKRRTDLSGSAPLAIGLSYKFRRSICTFVKP
ncbi:Aquaporin-1, partial [Ophiophagus hannah]